MRTRRIEDTGADPVLDTQRIKEVGASPILGMQRTAETGADLVMGMRRIEDIMTHREFVELQAQIDAAEHDRRFCRHDLTHLLDVARILCILTFEDRFTASPTIEGENALALNREIIYAAALLHDLGRARQYQDGTDHHQTGAEIAGRILPDCGFSVSETHRISEAIAQHAKNPGCSPVSVHEVGLDGQMSAGCSDLAVLLYRSDKLSRRCFACAAYDDCYWSEENKNKRVLY